MAGREQVAAVTLVLITVVTPPRPSSAPRPARGCTRAVRPARRRCPARAAGRRAGSRPGCRTSGRSGSASSAARGPRRRWWSRRRAPARAGRSSAARRRTRGQRRARVLEGRDDLLVVAGADPVRRPGRRSCRRARPARARGEPRLLDHVRAPDEVHDALGDRRRARRDRHPAAVLVR